MDRPDVSELTPPCKCLTCVYYTSSAAVAFVCKPHSPLNAVLFED